MLTPSSNTVLEPFVAAMLAELPDVSAHFARFPVTEISLQPRALDQFDPEPMLRAAELLADARVDVVCWNGTSAGWLGLEADDRLCAAIAERTGIAATSSVKSLVEILQRTRVRRLGLVTPYTRDVQARILATLERAGFSCAAERHAGERVNFAFAEIPEATIARMVREVAEARPDAVTVFCTNLRGAAVVEALERELGIPVYDTVATAVWGSLDAVGVAQRRVLGWGSLFQEVG